MNRLKLFIVFTCFASVLNAQQPNLKLVPESYRNHPEYGKLTINGDPLSVELIQHRTENARTFVDRSGQYHTTQTGGYFHYKNSKGEWISIQETVSQKGSTAGIFQSEMPMSVDVHTGKTEMTLEKNGRSILFGSNASLNFIGENNQLIKSSASNSAMTGHTADEHDLTLKNIFPHIDRVQTMEYWSLRTDYKVNRKLDLPVGTKYVEFADEMQLPAGWILQYHEGEMTAEGWQGTLAIVNEEGFVVSTISKPLYYDALESKRREDLNGHFGMGFYHIERTGSGFTLKLQVPADWFNNDALVYPLTIDPTATNTYASIQALQDKNVMFNSNCQTSMTLSIPAGAYQVTGTNTSWRIWAKGFIYTNNYADKTEQRSRVGNAAGTSWTAVQSGTGTNHSGSGYTYTAANNGQTYTLNNQNIANGCYNSSTITYTWQGYQTFFPHSSPAAAAVSGCATNYQELVVNTWQITTTYNPLTMAMTATPTAQTICSGQATGIALSSTSTGTTYAWTVVQNGTSGAANGNGSNIAQTLTATGTTAGTATYTITPTYGSCIGTPTTVVITVNPMPVVSAGPDLTICGGQSVTLNGAGADTYSWNNGVVNGQPFTPSGAGTYIVTGTLNGCTGTDQMTISIGALSTLNAGADQTICAGQPVTLNAIGADSYSWNNGVVNNVAFTPTATATYEVTGTSGGCTATDQVTVTVTPLPIANAGVDQAICAGGSVILSATGISNPVWDNNVVDGQSFSPATTTTYTVTGTLNGCPGADQVTVTVTPLPVVSAGNDQAICEGSSVTLVGTGATTFVWNNGVTNGVPFTPTATATYQVTGTTNGCTATDQVTVTVTPTPVATFTPTATSGCLPLTVTFNSSATQGNNTCQWIFGDGGTSTNCGQVTHTYTTAGCFDVTLITTTPNGCVGQHQLNDIVCTSPDPIAEFTANPGTLTMLDSYASMINTSQNAASYLWNFGDGTPTSTVENPGHAFPWDLPGTYQITLVAFNEYGCRDTARVNIAVEEELVYYVPNSFTPDDDQHNPVFKPVFTSGFDPYDYTLLIFNRWGEIIFESHDALYGWPGTYGEGNEIVKDGTYTWRIDFKTTRTDERKLLLGTVTLIR